tara:strand:- start:2235 stop:2672 length:438 start_codon:yes stop_codon:yes gene_type:complete
MKRILLFLIVLSVATNAWTQTLNTEPELTTKDIYLELTYLQESQYFYDEDEEYDYAYRFILTTDEIYDQVYLEKVIYGMEGGSKKLAWRKKLDMEVFYEYGIIGEVSNVELDKWTKNDSFIMSIHESQFEISKLSSRIWTIKRKK